MSGTHTFEVGRICVGFKIACMSSSTFTHMEQYLSTPENHPFYHQWLTIPSSFLYSARTSACSSINFSSNGDFRKHVAMSPGNMVVVCTVLSHSSHNLNSGQVQSRGGGFLYAGVQHE